MSNFSICTDDGLTIESSDYTELRKKLMMGQLKQFLNVLFFFCAANDLLLHYQPLVLFALRVFPT